MPTDIILPEFIDSTMLSCFRSCHQRFYNEFILGLRPAEISIHLHAGAAFSGALERFYKIFWEAEGTIDQETALRQTLPRFLELWNGFEPGKPTVKSRENMWEALNVYLQKWPAATDPVQPLEFNKRKTVEFSFSVPLDFPGFPRHPVSGGPFIYCGRIDLLGLYGGKTCVRDEKTTGRLETNWASQWDLRSQFLGYCWGCTVSGIPCDTAVVRGIVIYKREIVCVEAIKLYAQWELERWFEQLKRDLNALVKCWNDKWFDYDLADACTMWGGCSYADLCKSKEPQNWYDTYKTKRWNPLDRNPIEPAQGV